MLRRFFVTPLLLLAPVVVFAALVYWREGAFWREMITVELVLRLMGWLFGLIVVEMLVLRWGVIPKWTQAVGDGLYGGTYTPADDAVVAMAEDVRRSADPAKLERLERLVRADSTRTRGWRELAEAQQYVFHKPEQALQTLITAADAVRDKEDCAMLLCRAAYLAGNTLHRQEEADRLYREAARRYPSTVYGRQAAARVE